MISFPIYLVNIFVSPKHTTHSLVLCDSRVATLTGLRLPRMILVFHSSNPLVKAFIPGLLDYVFRKISIFFLPLLFIIGYH